MAPNEGSSARSGFHPSSGFEYYSGDVYWNSFELVQHHINMMIANNPALRWSDYLKTKYPQFNDCLSINCGNGWVERELFEVGACSHVSGFDFSQSLLDEAIRSAEIASIPATYWRADCNLVDLGSSRYDLVVNHAAMHHVAYINRLTGAIASALTENGRYVGFDYVGPHRNQYQNHMWSSALAINDSLPIKFRNNIMYPHMKTMLEIDRTEAIHSELQMMILDRYFDLEVFVPLGGAIAYIVLFNNANLYRHRDSAEGKAAIRGVLDADRDFLLNNPGQNLFAFWVARPKRGQAAPSPDMRLQWQSEEDRRESSAETGDGRYYPPTDMERVYNDWELRVRVLHALAERPVAASVAAPLARPSEPLEGQPETGAETWLLQQQNSLLKRQISDIRSSTSWRVTAPLRAMKSAILRQQG